MIQIAIIGLGTFGVRMLEELDAVNADVIILDKSRDVIEKYKSMARDAYITDAINEEVLKKIIPLDIDAVVVDAGGKIEVSMMVTNYLHKLGIKKIIVKAETDEHGEVLKLVGATQVVFPEIEAAKKIVPILTSRFLFNYMQITDDFALAEIGVNQQLAGKTLLETNLRRDFGLNVVAYRKAVGDDFSFIASANFRFEEGQILLVAGTEEAIQSFLDKSEVESSVQKKNIFQALFPKKGH